MGGELVSDSQSTKPVKSTASRIKNLQKRALKWRLNLEMSQNQLELASGAEAGGVDGGGLRSLVSCLNTETVLRGGEDPRNTCGND